MNCIIAGDFNFPLISWDDMSSTDRLSNVFFNTLNENMLHNVFRSHTRENNILGLTIYLYSKGDYENINEKLDQINKYDPNRDMGTNWRRFREVY